MSRPTFFHPKGPSVQVATSPSLGHLDHKTTATTAFESPSSYSSPSSSFASTPMASTMESPATVCSDNLYQVASRSSHIVSSSGGGSQQGPFVEFIRAHPKGAVRFRPFEEGLDDVTRRYIEEFQIYPFGSIEEFCRHIPYASGKKDFFEKTGRESFEVFQYVFKVPGDDKEYHVMWDYNVGLVRMTPFFKCCKYSKTTPAKMLNLNPGLRDITHSITGGSIMAQGYWMPYLCAKAVCATFCYHIAGALVPIFGPDFPSECLPPQSSDFARMVIDAALIADATRETEMMRQAIMRGLEDGTASSSSFHRSQMPHPVGSFRDSYCQQLDVSSRPSSMHHRVLPPLGSPHARPVSSSHVGERDGGPQLAPISYAVSRHDSHLLPSPVEHERLPPLSHVTVLSSVTLPTLFHRDDHERNRYSYCPKSDQKYTTSHPYQQTHRPLPSLRDYEDDISAMTEEHARYTQPRRQQWNSPPPSGFGPFPFTPDHHSRARSKVEDTQQSSMPQISSVPHAPPVLSHGIVEHRSDAVDSGHEDNNGQNSSRFASSYCYPSPPRRQHAHLYYPVETERRQPSDTVEVDTKNEVKYATTIKTTKMMPGIHLHPQQKATIKQRKLKVNGGPVGMPSSSSSMWNATDVDAAEVLVNFSVKMKGSDDEGEDELGGESGIRRPVHAKKSKHNPRFSASIASLLCDDEAPSGNKRRRS